jgi:two-component system LytT family response regulator
VGEAADGLRALDLIEELTPDLVFLDIQMPGLDGFEMLDAVAGEREFIVVFSTAHDEHALRAFDAHALDYLLKPFDGDRFQQALEKALRVLAGGGPRTRPSGAGARLVVRSDRGWVAVDPGSVVRASADDKRAILYTTGGEIRVRQGMSALSLKLDAERFVRVHRSEVVRLDAVVRYEPSAHGDGILILTDGSAVVLSRTRREEFLRRFRERRT